MRGDATARRPRPVAVFDMGAPPALAFVRSLGRCGVPIIAYSSRRSAGGRFSRYVSERRACPPQLDSEEFVAWLADAIARHEIDLIAPTSDTLAFSVGEAVDRLGGRTVDRGLPPAHAMRTCLFKGKFADALDALDFPTPPAAIPESLEEAIAVAEQIGYPVMIKPRSHVGIGTHRGFVVSDRHELAASYERYEVGRNQHAALRHVPLLALPILQKYFPPGTVDVVSLSGCLDGNGDVLAIAATKKLRQLPRRFGVGTLFEPVDLPPFVDDAVRVIRAVPEHGIFELEVLVAADGSYSAIDLNPRGFGQMSLDIARGNDLPRLWYRSFSGVELSSAPLRPTPPSYWQDAVPFYADLAVSLLREPDRRAVLAGEWRRSRAPRVGASFDVTDPLPGVLLGLSHFRHPRALYRQLVTDVESRSPNGLRQRRGTPPSPAHDDG